MLTHMLDMQFQLSHISLKSKVMYDFKKTEYNILA